MCTISLVPHPDSPNGFILTSNRDEVVSRKTIPPAYEIYHHTMMYFPKDSQAGGTWIGLSENNRCVCLMNGAEESHQRKKSYRLSRGVVVKDFLAGEDKKNLSEEYDFKGIEPFTMIVVDWNNGLLFYELIWDEKDVKVNKLALKDHIWSSSPLYSKEMKKLRSKWFDKLKRSKGFNSESLLYFHHNAGKGNKEFDLVMDRGFLKTQSISQISNSSMGMRFWYKDLSNNKVKEEFVQFKA